MLSKEENKTASLRSKARVQPPSPLPKKSGRKRFFFFEGSMRSMVFYQIIVAVVIKP